MPYRRAPRSRYRRRTRRTRYTTTGSALHLARQAARGVYYLKGLVNSEKFKHDVSAAGTLTNTGTVVALTGITQGDDEVERTGNSIFVRSSHTMLKIYRDVSVGNDTQLVRVALIMDMQQGSDLNPTFAGIYQINGPLNFLDLSTVGRFKVLWNRFITLDKTNQLSKVINKFYKLRHHVRYNGSASTDIQKGGLYLVMSSDQTSSGFPSFTLEHRLSYHDN